MQATIARVEQSPSASKPKAFLIGKPKKQSMRKAIAESRQIIADNLPRVIQNLAERARFCDGKAADATHLKLFLEVSGVLKAGLAPPEKVVREKTLEEILVEQWDNDKRFAAAREQQHTPCPKGDE